VARSIDRWLAPMRKRLWVEKQRGPDPFGVRASAYRDSKVRVYALPSPGCTRSSLRSSCPTCHMANRLQAGCMAAPHVPSDPITAARANATRPFMGRLVLTALREFTMGSLENRRSPGAGWDTTDRTVNSLYPTVNPLRE
jgi:hypothetical protein